MIANQPSATAAASYWDEVLVEWRAGAGQRLLRAYADEINARLLDAWLPGRSGSLLKTDAFDEAVGTGLWPLLRSHADHVVVVDVSRHVLRAARQRYPELDGREADVRHLEFPAGTFEAVVSLSTLDHFHDRSQIALALTELHRVLVPGGSLIVTLDNARSPLVALRNAVPPRLLVGTGLVPYAPGATCGPKRLRQVLAQTGFDVRELSGVMHVPRLAAMAAAVVAEKAAARPSPSLLLASLMRLDRLAPAPLRLFSGQFVAARAVRR